MAPRQPSLIALLKENSLGVTSSPADTLIDAAMVPFSGSSLQPELVQDPLSVGRSEPAQVKRSRALGARDKEKVKKTMVAEDRLLELRDECFFASDFNARRLALSLLTPKNRGFMEDEDDKEMSKVIGDSLQGYFHIGLIVTRQEEQLRQLARARDAAEEKSDNRAEEIMKLNGKISELKAALKTTKEENAIVAGKYKEMTSQVVKLERQAARTQKVWLRSATRMFNNSLDQVKHYNPSADVTRVVSYKRVLYDQVVTDNEEDEDNDSEDDVEVGASSN